MRAVLKSRSDITRQQVARIRDLMNENIAYAMVFGFERRIDALTLPDPFDRHVLAAAIHCRASLIVTFNLKHFPLPLLRKHHIQPRDPDGFVGDLLDNEPARVCVAARRHRQSLKSPPLCVEEYLQKLEACQIGKAVKAMRTFSANL